eukprot:11470499-Alexandrium_andersonii.AAC.1
MCSSECAKARVGDSGSPQSGSSPQGLAIAEPRLGRGTSGTMRGYRAPALKSDPRLPSPAADRLNSVAGLHEHGLRSPELGA